ncbi:hypothetical protein BGZ93_003852 [Podila epicladia]|nr:hypothetical protein BGZ92_010456 [Podila epicladia]KAG0100148.1 hypothetical protein BGZ93_003852 [Podila epicladia]
MGYTKTYKNGSTPSVCIIGAGFSGICAAIRLETQLNLTSYEIFDLEPELGGTWWSNTYPGVACDIKSHNYAFSFEPNYDWSCVYAGGAEILEYLRGVARKYGVDSKIQFRHRIARLEWRADLQKWRVGIEKLETGETFERNYDLVFAGMGPLRVPKIPEEFDAFEGPKWHTAQWNHEFDLTGKRIAVVGSGASAIQVVPSIVDKVKTLEFYQRSATYIIPRRNGRYNAVWRFFFRYVPFFHWIYYRYLYYTTEFTIQAFSTKWRHIFTRLFAVWGAWLVRYTNIKDKQLRAKLTPHYQMGCRRIVVSSDFYPALQRSHVNVHTAGIQSIKGNTIMLKDGTTQEVDAMVLATGFRIMDILPEGSVFGKDGCDVVKVWGMDPKTYYGVTSAETPNMFFLLGPNTGLGHNSVLFMVEAQVDFAIKTISFMMQNELSSVQATGKACQDFVDLVGEKMKDMVWSSNCHSWYKNEQGRVTALWHGDCSSYARKMRKFKPEHFLGVRKVRGHTEN